MGEWLTSVIQDQQWLVALSIAGSVLAYLLKAHKDRKDAEDSAVDESQRQYYDYLKICIRYPELRLGIMEEETPIEEMDANSRRQQRVAYEFLIGVFEIAYFKHHDVQETLSLIGWIGNRVRRWTRRRASRPNRQEGEESIVTAWTGWEKYIGLYLRRPAFREAYGFLNRYLHPDFCDYMDGLLKKQNRVDAVADVKLQALNAV